MAESIPQRSGVRPSVSYVCRSRLFFYNVNARACGKLAVRGRGQRTFRPFCRTANVLAALCGRRESYTRAARLPRASFAAVAVQSWRRRLQRAPSRLRRLSVVHTSRRVTRTELNWQNYSETHTLSLRISFPSSKLAIANYATRFAVFAANRCGVGRYDVARERA